MQTNKFKQDDHRFDSYIQTLRKHGLQLHPSLTPAIFTLNNGLEYPGLQVSTPVMGQTNLVTIPTTLLLTSHKARQEPALSQVFQHSFYNTGELWQDRILITYLLYLYQQKDQSNVWFHMVERFSKDIDILSFWSIGELDHFSDQSVKKAAVLERENFEKQWEEFQNVKEDHQQFFGQFDQQAFGKDNYQWIYTHAVSRCFGSFMNSTYFTPFCEFFNHHCVDVSYQCVTQDQYNHQLEQKKQSINQGSPLSLQQQDQNQDDLSETSSISSYNSVDYIEDGDFNYWQVESYKIKWGGKVSFDLKEKETKEVQKLYSECFDVVEKSLVWSGFNFVFMGQVIEKLNITKNEYMAGRKKFMATKEEFGKMKGLIESYKSHATSFYRTSGGKYDPRTQTQQSIDNLPKGNTSTSHHTNHHSASVYQKTSSPPVKDYKYFLMESGSAAEFKENQQIYFCYGKVSNRTMLVRYGCCIEDNLYEHVWMKLGLGKVLSPYPDLFERVQEKGLSITYKHKLKPTVWPYELYLWLKVQKWQLIRHSIHQIFFPSDIDQQIEIFQNISTIINEKIPQYSVYPSYQNLSDQKISYHEYFTRVYHKEKVKVLQKHLKMAGFVIERLKEMKEMKRLIKPKEFKEKLFYKELKGYWKVLSKGLVAF